MNRTQKRRWAELELKRANLQLEAAKISAEQAALALHGVDQGKGNTETPRATNRQQMAAENRAKIAAYLATIQAGQCGHTKEASDVSGVCQRTVKNHVKTMPEFSLKNGMIIRLKTVVYSDV